MTARSPEFENGVLGARRALMGFAMSLTYDRDRAEDLVSDTILKALEHHTQFQPGTNLKSWLFTILRNHLFSQSRRKKREIPDPDGVIASQVRVNEGQSWAFDLKVIRKRMRHLSPDRRRMVELVAILGHEYEDVAQMLGVPIGTVKSGINRARHFLETGEEMVEAIEVVPEDPECLQADLIETLYLEGMSVSEIKAVIEGVTRSEIMQVILDRKLSAKR